MEFLKIISGSKLWYLEENVGPWDPDEILKDNIGVQTLVFGGKCEPWDPGGIFKNNIGSKLWYLEENMGPVTPMEL